MMSSSSDELLRQRRRTRHRRRESAGHPRQADRAGRRSRSRSRRGTITGLLGPSGCGKTTLMRSIVGTQIIAHGHGHGAGPPARFGSNCATASATCTQDPTIYDDLRIIDNVRYFAVAVRHGLRTPPTHAIAAVGLERSPNGACAATSPAVSAPARRWPARWCRNPTCWCSTNPPSALTPCCASTSGSSSTQLARSGTTLLVSSHVMDEADHCGDLLLMRDGHLLAHTTPDQATRGHRMSVTGGSVSVRHPAQHRSPRAG